MAIYGECIQEMPATVPVDHFSGISRILTGCTEDRRMNFGLQVVQLGMFLMLLTDTVAEGDARGKEHRKLETSYVVCTSGHDI